MITRYRRRIPADVARKLRQEAGFGCAKCGHPYLEYHHIVPWRDDQHYRVEDMVALCANCHANIDVYRADRQYQLKYKPKNIVEDRVQGFLDFDKRDLIFRVGGNWFENVDTMIQFRNTPIVSARIIDNQARVSLNLFNSAGRLVLQVVDNEIALRASTFWDFECRQGVAIARSATRSIALRMDFQGNEASIEGEIWMGGKAVRLGREETSVGTNTLRNNRIVGSRVGIQIG
ncbi:HNH endonuclease [Kaistia algarum]|uniref:HNH endonuclease n=1 Tax=Kaistia algarum TaxID=2083279 RepID=UPI0014021FDD|nr:HNH endonuclease signature motif containing protein [Kaistia algarum]MCX5513832.1 HNH endonuclease signature motif containing protein [Kaistia algarum]